MSGLGITAIFYFFCTSICAAETAPRTLFNESEIKMLMFDVYADAEKRGYALPEDFLKAYNQYKNNGSVSSHDLEAAFLSLGSFLDRAPRAENQKMPMNPLPPTAADTEIVEMNG